MKRQIACFFSNYRLPLLSGFLIGTSYIPFYPWALFYGLAPLWLYCLKNEQPKKVFWGGWVTQFVLTLIGFHWVAYTAHEFGHLPWPLSVLALLAFCAVSHLHIPVAAWLWAKIHRKFDLSLAQSVILLVLMTATAENLSPMIFPWNHGYPWLWADWQAFQFAEFIGFEGLSLLTIAANGWILWLWLQRSQRSYAIKGLVALLALVVVANFLGRQHGSQYKKTDASVRLLSVQANIGNLMKVLAEKGRSRAGKSITEKYFSLTSQGLQENPEVDYIIWPETAFPDYLGKPHRHRSLSRQLASYIRSIDKPLITGAYSLHAHDPRPHNSLFFINSDGHIELPAYHKTILLAFGEYFPGSQHFPSLKKLIPAISDFGRGQGPTVTNFNGVAFGPQICYEGLYPWFSRELALRGAQVFINITNDSWFGDHFEPYQHLYMTLGRTIEFRRPLVRTTNTGYTTAILADGSIFDLSTLHQEWTGVFDIKYAKNPKLTFFARYGQYFSYLLTLLTVLSILTVIFTQKKRLAK